MTAPQDQPGGIRDAAARTAAATLRAIEQLAGGLGTALLALGVLVAGIVAAAGSVVGIGLLLIPPVLRASRGVTDRERARLGRWGPEVLGPGPVPRGLRAVADPTVRRELRWLAGHATLGLLAGLIGVLLPLFAVRDLTFPLWWRLLPDGQATPSIGFWAVDDWPGVLAVALLGLGWCAVAVGFAPALARAQAGPGRRLLAPAPGTDLPLRIAQLTATRAAALDAHAAELRRIERSLHDGTQNRLVAVAVFVGAARRSLTRDPANADALLAQAQDAAEQALHELRSVARGILPPVLADRGLAGALAGLAAACPVPCQVDLAGSRRCAASVEATAYYVVAEALTNVARHSGATRATVTVRTTEGRLTVQVSDDGHGGAADSRGSGLDGIRRRVEAHDGTLTVASPPGGPTTLEARLPCGS